MLKSVLGRDSCNLSFASHEEVLCLSFFTFCRFSLFQKDPFFKVILCIVSGNKPPGEEI